MIVVSIVREVGKVPHIVQLYQCYFIGIVWPSFSWIGITIGGLAWLMILIANWILVQFLQRSRNIGSICCPSPRNFNVLHWRGCEPSFYSFYRHKISVRFVRGGSSSGHFQIRHIFTIDLLVLVSTGSLEMTSELASISRTATVVFISGRRLEKRVGQAPFPYDYRDWWAIVVLRE